MPLGKVKWFNNAKGYGFIIADESEKGDYLNEDLFAHFSSIQMEGYKTLKAGQAVQFEAQPSGKGYHAVNIVPVDTPQEETVPAPASASEGSAEKESESHDKVEALAANA